MYLASKGCSPHFSAVRDYVLTSDKHVLDQSWYLVSMIWVGLGKTSTAGRIKGLFWSWHKVLSGQSHLENFEKLVHQLILQQMSKMKDLHFRMILLLILKYAIKTVIKQTIKIYVIYLTMVLLLLLQYVKTIYTVYFIMLPRTRVMRIGSSQTLTTTTHIL